MRPAALLSLHVRPVHFSIKRALPGANFMPSDSGELKEKGFLHFQGKRKSVLGSMLIEYNAENEEIIPF